MSLVVVDILLTVFDMLLESLSEMVVAFAVRKEIIVVGVDGFIVLWMDSIPGEAIGPGGSPVWI